MLCILWNRPQIAYKLLQPTFSGLWLDLYNIWNDMSLEYTKCLISLFHEMWSEGVDWYGSDAQWCSIRSMMEIYIFGIQPGCFEEAPPRLHQAIQKKLQRESCPLWQRRHACKHEKDVQAMKMSIWQILKSASNCKIAKALLPNKLPLLITDSILWGKKIVPTITDFGKEHFKLPTMDSKKKTLLFFSFSKQKTYTF